MKQVIATVLVFLLLPTMCFGEDEHASAAHEGEHGVEALSADLRALLNAEMQALQGGMTSLIPALISGNRAEVEAIAGKMEASYIMKQRLTASQAKELHATLPHEFVKLDQRFHYLAGMLEHAANKQKPELMNFYFAEMIESCVNCHATFATKRFPGLSANQEEEHQH